MRSSRDGTFVGSCSLRFLRDISTQSWNQNIFKMSYQTYLAMCDIETTTVDTVKIQTISDSIDQVLTIRCKGSKLIQKFDSRLSCICCHAWTDMFRKRVQTQSD